MKAGDIYIDRKNERQKELQKLSTSGVTRKNISALDPKYKKGGKKRRSKTMKRKTKKH